MQSLASICGLPLTYNEENNQCGLGEDISAACSKIVKLAELTPTLLNKSLRYPENVYSYYEQLIKKEHIDSGKWLPSIRYDMYVLPHGLLGIEYIKTHIYYTDAAVDKVACIVEVAFGELTIILQRNQPKDEFDFDTHVDEAWTIKVMAGEKAAVPTGYMFSFVNASNGSVVFSVVRTGEQIIDYHRLTREQGMAYFLIAKNARTEVVTNPRYRTTPNITMREIEELVNVSIDFRSKPLYDLAVESASELLTVLVIS
jgi:oxalate decarboxylase/phosphoglucose isomerase-like protein (cupin superfamily)